MNETGYRITLAAGILLAGVLFAYRLRRNGEKRAFIFAPMGVVAGFAVGWLFSKLVFLLMNGNDLLSEAGIAAFFRVGTTEFSFVASGFGAVAGVAAAARIARKGGLLKRTVPEILDMFALPGCLLIAWARLCELYLGQTGLGELASMGLPEIGEGSLLAFFPVSVADPWGGRLLAVCTLEALAALTVGLLCLLPRNRYLPVGLCFEKAAFRVCGVQIFLEMMRIVSATFFFVHVDQALCGMVLCAIMTAECVRVRRKTGKCPAAPPVLLVLCMVVNGLTQYFMDKPWQLEGLLPETAFEWMTERLAPLGFGIMLLTTVGMLLAGRMIRKKLLAVGWSPR